jgi:hypothetical protein
MLKLLAATAAVAVLAGAPTFVPRPAVAETSDAAANPAVAATEDPTAAVLPIAPVVSMQPDITVTGASADEAAALAKAIDRFRTAGLALPDLEVVFHDESAPCKGHEGLFQAHQTPWRVQICSELAFVVTHELAHAWERANLTDDDRQRFLDHEGLTTWSSTEADRSDRGIEEAAFVIQQNLMAQHADAESARWVELTSAYDALVGQPSPVLSRGR